MTQNLGSRPNAVLTQAFGSLADSIFPDLATDLQPYRDDPVKFARDVLGCHLTEDQKRIMESVARHPYTLVETANGVGKSFCAGRIALWYTRCHIGAQTYMVAAPPENNLVSILWGEIEAAVKNASPVLMTNVKKRRLSLIFGEQWWIQGITIPTSGTASQREAKFSGRHAPYLLFILDEADAIPPEVWRGVQSCMSGGIVRALIMFNPREPSGWAYSLRDNPDTSVLSMSAFRHPNVIRGIDMIPGAVTGDITVRRIQSWSRPVTPQEEPDENTTFVVPDFLDSRTTLDTEGREREPLVGGQVRVVTEPMLDYMVLGRYSGMAGRQLVPLARVKAAQQRFLEYRKTYGDAPPDGATRRIGIDIGEYDGDRNAICERWRSWVAPLITWTGYKPESTGDRIVSMYGEEPYEAMFVDSIGVGAGFPGQLRRKGLIRLTAVKTSERPTTVPRTEEGDKIGEFAQLRDQLYWLMAEWLRTDEEAMLPPDVDLEAELVTPTYETRNGKIRVMNKIEMRKRLGRSPDKMDALALTFAEPARVRLACV